MRGFYMRTYLLLFIFFYGCATTLDTLPEQVAPRIVSLTSLPPLTTTELAGHPEFKAYFYILIDGSVEEIRLEKSSGDAYWDSAAVDSMKQWRFTPLHEDTHPRGQWVEYTIRVVLVEPIWRQLGELVAFTKKEADSLYMLISEGADFYAIARQKREDTNEEIGRYLGTVDILRFPEHVRNELRKLRAGKCTTPILVGNHYIIYKRFKEDL
jgi:TonB family protein